MRKTAHRSSHPQRGMTLIELTAAVTVLVIGMLGVAILISVGVSNNTRNKLDTGGTLLAQTVLERLATPRATEDVAITLTDCNPGAPQVFVLNTTDAAVPGAGAAIDNATGNIDFAQDFGAIPVGYRMRYVACGSGGTQITYDVRWNVRTINQWSKLITVAARQVGANNNNLRFFAPPVNLRTIAGN